MGTYESTYYGSSAASGASASAASGAGGILIFFMIVIMFLVLAAWLVSISLFIKAAKEKGYYEHGGTGLLWFIGIFATPIVVGLYTTSLPDLRDQKAKQKETVETELPAV
ncbi:MAG: hypothetical protein SPG07_00505 [Coriobacteriales bacterium]|nr:hypothetical protein [Coriobacteriales bacterium]